MIGTSSLIIMVIKRNGLGGACGMQRGRGEESTEFWWGNLTGKRPLRRPRLRWEDNIRMDLKEIGRERMWTGLIWLRMGTSGGL